MFFFFEINLKDVISLWIAKIGRDKTTISILIMINAFNVINYFIINGFAQQYFAMCVRKPKEINVP